MAYSSDPVVHNHLLFSELFLDEVRSDTHDLGNVRPTLSTIQGTWKYHIPASTDFTGAIWAPVAPISLDDPVELRAKVIKQVLAYVKLSYGPCKANEHSLLLYAERTREDCVGLCLVLPYTANIEGRDPKTGIIPKGRNYAQQLIHLLRQHDLNWGVLTNGRHWRLFHRNELSPTETYLHIDLERIIATDDIQDYIVFHRFFSHPAFARQDSRQRLDLYKQQSDKRTEVIEDHLSAHVEEIARQLCQGLVKSRRAAGEEVASGETRMAIYKNALFLVYRLLFVLYAEARDLLPLDVPAYYNVCLRDLLAEVCANHEHGMQYDNAYGMWDRLQALFALIDQGDSIAGVAAYNGGLFDPKRRPFLTAHRIRNEYLQAALIRLSTMPAKGKSYDQDRTPRSIDYRDLSVRHLGSLYEGLLEYNLFVVEDEQRVVRVSKKNTQYVPYSQAGKVRSKETILEVGDVYFSETEGERKVTGSYYTPEDVVGYIVLNTVGEKLRELKFEFYEEHDIQRQLADLADTPPDIPAHNQIQRALDYQFVRFVREEVLDLKILDPAMGSGHFLVNATHAVANFVVELLNETPWQNQEIDTDVATWKRLVAERCIFGVDLNELAVELAKLCLWMTTTAKGKPLTFLDHHLRWGDSLVGAWLKEVGIYPLAKKESEHAFTLPMERFEVRLDQALTSYQKLYAKSSDDVEDVREKARIFSKEIQPILQPYRELLDLHTGIYFGNGWDETAYAELGSAVSTPCKWMQVKAARKRDIPDQLVEQCWFHWELEFPEVFQAEEKGRFGFDIALGNPPYAGYPKSLSTIFLDANYDAVSSKDLYALFLERAIHITRSTSGHLGFIVPLSLTFSNRLASLRDVLRSELRAWSIYSFDKRPQAIFQNVQQRTSIILGHPSRSVMKIMSGRLARWRPEERNSLFSNLKAFDCSDLVLDIGIPKLGSDIQGRALRQLLSTGGSVGDHFAKDWDNLGPGDLETVTVYFFGVAYRWLVAAKTLPPPMSPDGKPIQLSGFSSLYFKNEEAAWAHMAVLNSLVAVWFWLMYGDSFHVTKSLLSSLPIDIDLLTEQGLGQLVRLGKELQEEMSKHIFYSRMRGKITANYNLLACKYITGKIDQLLVKELSLGADFLSDMEGFCAAAAGLQ